MYTALIFQVSLLYCCKIEVLYKQNQLIRFCRAAACTLNKPIYYDDGEFDSDTDDLAGQHFTLDEQCQIQAGASASACFVSLLDFMTKLYGLL